MKKIVLALAIMLSTSALFAQTAYTGSGDVRFNIGAEMQKGGTGIVTILDLGLGESFSAGLQLGYLLGVKKVNDITPDFGDRFDTKLRFNANLGSVIGLPESMDVYPGLDLGLRNFGGHLGMRYFFQKGFGVYTEIQFPFAKYKDSNDLFHNLNNQFAFHIGASFDLSK